jgi:hypothetical protein
MEGGTDNPAARAEPGINCAVCGRSVRGLPAGSVCPNCRTEVALSVEAPKPRPARPAVRPTARGDVVLDDRPCLVCGYNLRSLPASGKCPECGAAVARSLKGVLLRYCAPEYVARLRRGILMVEAAIGLEILAKLLMVGLNFTAVMNAGVLKVSPGPGPTGATFSGYRPTLALERTSLLISIALQALSLVGWWWFTTPDPGLAERDPADRWRRILRFFLALSAATAAVNFVTTFVPSLMTQANAAAGGLLPKVTVRLAIKGLSEIAFLVGFIATMLYMMHLARRLPDLKLKKTAELYTWLLPVVFIGGFLICGVGPLTAFVLYVLLIDAWRQRLSRLEGSVMEEDLRAGGLA